MAALAAESSIFYEDLTGDWAKFAPNAVAAGMALAIEGSSQSPGSFNFDCINPSSFGASSSALIDSKAASAIFGRGSLLTYYYSYRDYEAKTYCLALYSLFNWASLLN